MVIQHSRKNDGECANKLQCSTFQKEKQIPENIEQSEIKRH